MFGADMSECVVDWRAVVVVVVEVACPTAKVEEEE